MEALNHGLEGKGSLSIAGGTFVLTCGKDGLRSENTEDASLGSVYIQNGEFQIDAQGDAVSASGALQVDGGTFSIVTAGGSETVTMDTGEGFGQGRFSFPGSSSESDAASEDASTDTASAKGLKADGTIFIQGGTLDLTCNGSGNTALDTDGSYANNGGTVTTNDGSEENPGAMGGGQGGMGGKMGGGRQNSTTPPSSTAP